MAVVYRNVAIIRGAASERYFKTFTADKPADIGFNYVPLRFVAFLAGVVTLAVIWTRFAEQNLNWHLL